MALKRKRNLFLTKTAIGIYASVCGLLVSVAPNVQGLISRGKIPTQKAEIADLIGLVAGTVGAVGTFIGRYDAGGTYTPKGIPGRDKVGDVIDLNEISKW